MNFIILNKFKNFKLFKYCQMSSKIIQNYEKKGYKILKPVKHKFSPIDNTYKNVHRKKRYLGNPKRAARNKHKYIYFFIFKILELKCLE